MRYDNVTVLVAEDYASLAAEEAQLVAEGRSEGAAVTLVPLPGCGGPVRCYQIQRP